MTCQDSPVFRFISNLSPLVSVKTDTVTQGFTGVNSPPLVFSSIELYAPRLTESNKRDQSPEVLSEKLSAPNIGCKNDASEKSRTRPSTSLIVCTGKETESECPLICQSPEESLDQFMTDAMNEDFVNTNVSYASTMKNLGNNDQFPASSDIRVSHEQERASISEKMVPDKPKKVKEICKEDSAFDGRTMDDDTTHKDSVSVGMIAKVGAGFPLDLDLKNKGHKATPEDLQHHVISRRCLQFEDAHLEVMPNQPAQIPSDADTSKSPCLQSVTKNQGNKEESVQRPICASINNFAVKIPKPLGIGLHLNSIVNAGRTGPGVTVNVKSSQRGNINVRTKKLEHGVNCRAIDYKNSSSETSLAKNVPSSGGFTNEIHGLETAASTVDVLDYKNKNSSNIANAIEDQSALGKRKYDCESDAGFASCNSSPKKKRKESSYPSGGDGCKRCKCKKSKCLKLYCDCFAAGLYCGESCACRDCYNVPEHNDKVQETRQLIESRNPLAFAPRVVPNFLEPPEDGALSTPSSARHKRGCNCKKSMCLKKYCECYQANVGCSSGCRCYGCQNVYGKNGENSYGTGNLVASGHLSYRIEHPDSHSQRNDDASQEWFGLENYFDLPESAPISCMDNNKKSCCNNTQAASEFSVVAGNCLDLQNPQDSSTTSKAQSSMIQASSHQWQGSPMTPMAQHNRLNFLGDADSGLSTIILDDSTPEILKESPKPLYNYVKVSSPNKKRVSPPHSRQLDASDPGINGGLRSGRKFILRAVSSFPPLTPCDDSKNTTFVQTEDSES